MTTRYVLNPVESLEDIEGFHRRIFDEPLERERFVEKQENGRLDVFHILRRGDTGEVAVGFGVFVVGDYDVDFWLGGVLPEHRQQGAGAFLVEESMRRYEDEGKSRMRVTTYNRWNIMLSLLIRRGFRIVATEPTDRRSDLKILLQRELRRRRELRITLTEKCNFRCFFCHREGVAKQGRPGPETDPKGVPRRTPEEFWRVIEQAVQLGYTDITFTGGEPLLEKDLFLELLGRLGSLQEPPTVTLVTNAFKLDDEVVRALVSYPGTKKVHVSVHSFDPETFAAITGLDALDRVADRIRKAAEAGLEVKINHVLLAGHNVEDVRRTILEARKLGARAVKFLELLVLEDNAELFRHFYSIEALRTRLARMDDLLDPPIRRGLRRVDFPLKSDRGFVVETQQCTCQLGCIHCRELRDKTIDSGLRYHPCFVRSNMAYDTAGQPHRLAEIFEKGDRIIDQFAHKYGESSPSLDKKARYVDRRVQYVFLVRDLPTLLAELKDAGLHLVRKVVLEEEYYWPAEAGDTAGWEKVTKLQVHSKDAPRTALVCSTHRYERRNIPGLGPCLRQETTFLFPRPVVFPAWDESASLLRHMGLEPRRRARWDISFFSEDDSGGRDLVLSVGRTDGAATVVLTFANAEQEKESLGHFASLLSQSGAGIHPLLEPLPALARPVG